MPNNLLEDKEEWKSILGYNDRYYGSNLGRVKSVQPRTAERILSPALHSNGYEYVDLWRDGKVKHTRVNRIVAQLFCENEDPLTKTYVNHLDENKRNNRASNLAWATPSENTNWGSCIQRRVASRYNRPLVKESSELPAFYELFIV